MKHKRSANFHIFDDKSGQAVVEFAMLMPALFALIYGAMSFGVAYFKGLTIQWAVEDSVRRAMIDEDVTETQLQAAIDKTLNGIDPRLQIDITRSVYLAGEIPIVQVTGTFQQEVIVPVLPEMHLDFEIDSRAPRPAPEI